MTGFARGHGVAGAYAWNWEIKAVNAKGLDVRLRLPPGWDAVEMPARKRASEELSRGTVYANLTVERKGVTSAVKVNEQDQEIKRSIIDALASQKNVKAMIQIARAEKDNRMQQRILERLVNMKSPEASDYLMEIIKK